MIETGVDKLVELIKKAGRISVPDAAEKLGVSEDVVEEWADFLEEEGIISIEYKFATAYLQEKKLNNREIKEKEKEFERRKDVFVRKAEIVLKSLDKESTSFKTAEDQFKKIKNEIGSEVEHVRGEVEELEKLEELKKNLDADLIKQKHDYADKIIESQNTMKKEQEKYRDIVKEIVVEEKNVRKNIKNEECDINKLQGKEKLIAKKLENFKIMISKIEDRAKEDSQLIYNERNHIDNLKNLAKQVEEEIEEEQKKARALAEESKAREKDIIKSRSGILEKLKEKKYAIGFDVKKGKEISKKFEEFFNKKLNVYKMMSDLEHQKHDLQIELNQLIKRAQAFAASSKSGDVKGYAKELDKKFSEINKKKSEYESDIEKITSLLR